MTTVSIIAIRIKTVRSTNNSTNKIIVISIRITIINLRFLLAYGCSRAEASAPVDGCQAGQKSDLMVSGQVLG